MGGDGWIHQIAQNVFQGGKRSNFIGSHQARIARDIGGHYRRQSTFHALIAHLTPWFAPDSISRQSPADERRTNFEPSPEVPQKSIRRHSVSAPPPQSRFS
jgi:hypothetical protein